MNIVQLIPTLQPGGAERVAVNLAIGLRGKGHAVTIVAMVGPSHTALEADAARNHVPVEFLLRHKMRIYDPRIVPRLRHAILKARPDVIHTHLSVLKYLWPAADMARQPVVHTVHNLAHREARGPDRAVHRLLFRRGVMSVACAAAVAESMIPVYGAPPHCTIDNGIDLGRSASTPHERRDVRAELGMPDDAMVFVCVAGFRPEKNHRMLLNAFAKGAYQHGSHLLLVGDGALRPSIEAQVHSLGCADRVHILGYRSDVDRLLASADVFVLASHREGSPLSVMEAMVAGRAILATKVGGIPALVPSQAGWLVDAGDERAMSEAMRSAVVDRQAARARGAAAALAAHSLTSAAEMTDAYERVYTSAISRA